MTSNISSTRRTDMVHVEITTDWAGFKRLAPRTANGLEGKLLPKHARRQGHVINPDMRFGRFTCNDSPLAAWVIYIGPELEAFDDKLLVQEIKGGITKAFFHLEDAADTAAYDRRKGTC
jgi:hypothetical protein